MTKFLFYSSIAVLLCGCVNSELGVLSAKNVAVKSKVNPATLNQKEKVTFKKDETALYVCANQERLWVTRLNTLAGYRYSKNVPVNVTFNNITRRLFPMISNGSKRYANLRWSWWEKADEGFLSDSLGNILADQCIREE